MSTGHIYILTDGANTKIGITTSFDTRMASYKTHNATAQLFKQYQCPIQEAKRIEAAIKSIFKDALVGGKEWFAVAPETIDRYVLNLLEKPTHSVSTPGLHGVPLTRTANELQELINKQLSSKVREERMKAQATKEEMAAHFATAFGLGVPEHKLPAEHLIVQRDGPCVDMNHCTPPAQSEKVFQAIRTDFLKFPYDDHVWRFYNRLPLDTGHTVIVCTARVSMPYKERIEDPEHVHEIVDAANDYGWYCTAHHDWSWHYPEKTGLFLFQPKTAFQTRLAAWNTSFKKWVMERQEVLKLARFPDPEQLAYRIEDITTTKTFPLDVESYEDLCEQYLDPIWHMRPGLEGNEEVEEPFRFLFAKWKAER